MKSGKNHQPRWGYDSFQVVAFWLILAAIAAFRIWLSATQNYIVAIGEYDDYLLNHNGLSIYNGEWLGEYNKYRLIKGASYSLFVACSKALGLTYGQSMGILIVGCSLLFMLAAHTICKNRALLIVFFCLVAFSPMAWGERAGLHIHRQAMYAWLALAVFSSIVALFMHRHDAVRKSVPWIIALSVSMATIMQTREDALWVLPATIIALLTCGIIRIVQFVRDAGSKEADQHKAVRPRVSDDERRKRRLHRSRGAVGTLAAYLILLLLPFFVWNCYHAALSYMNDTHYGVFLANDRIEGGFADMMKQIMRIEDPDKNVEELWFTEKMLDDAIEASPTLQSIEDELRRFYKIWGDGFDSGYPEGDFMQWVIRDAMSDSGYFADATIMQEFSSSVAHELEEAFESGKLKDDGLIHVSTQGPGMRLEDFARYIPKAAINVLDFASFQDCSNKYPIYPNQETYEDERLKVFQEVTNMTFSSDEIESGYTTSRIENAITKVYKVIGIPLFVLSFVFLFVTVYLSARNHLKIAIPALLTTSSILLSVFLDVFIVTVFSEFLDMLSVYLYANSAFVLIPAFECLCAAWFYVAIQTSKSNGRSIASCTEGTKAETPETPSREKEALI